MVIIALLYVAAGYWATGEVLYKNKIIIEFQSGALFARKLIYGAFLGWILIPIAIVKKLLHL